MRQQTAVTDESGGYAFRDLPIGTYRAIYELAGFQRFVRDPIQLTAGFTATISVTLKVGALEETITVSGASPVVDVTSTSASVSLSSEAITEVIPAQRTLLEVVGATPGVVRSQAADLGGGVSGSQMSAYGMSGR